MDFLKECVWPIFFGALLFIYRKQLAAIYEIFRKRIEDGCSIKIGPFGMGQDINNYPKVDQFLNNNNNEQNKKENKDDREKERTKIYEENKGYFLTHLLFPSSKAGQKFDILIYLIRHKSQNLSEVKKAEFFFGHMWGNQVFEVTPNNNRVGISASAYGPFLCTCKLYLVDGSVLDLHRYIDFEMEGVINKLAHN